MDFTIPTTVSAPVAMLSAACHTCGKPMHFMAARLCSPECQAAYRATHGYRPLYG